MNYDYELAKAKTSCGESVKVSYDFFLDAEEYIAEKQSKKIEEIKKNIDMAKGEALCSVNQLYDQIDVIENGLDKTLKMVDDLLKRMRKSETKEELQSIRDYIDTDLAAYRCRALRNTTEYAVEKLNQL
jgi:Xaa-Pro aminopeptidase